MITQLLFGAVFLTLVVTAFTSVSRVTDDLVARMTEVNSRGNLQQSIANILNAPSICGASLGDQDLRVNDLSSKQSLTIHLPGAAGGSASVLARAGTEVDTLKVTSVSFQFTPTPRVVLSRLPPLVEGGRPTSSGTHAPARPGSDSSASRVFTGNLNISLTSLKTGMPYKELVFPMVVTMSGTGATGRIVSCMSSQVWQTLGSLQVCPQYYGVVGFASDGRLICRQGPPGPPGPPGGGGPSGACAGPGDAGAVCTASGWVTR